jgi:ATP-dependent DNA ligase
MDFWTRSLPFPSLLFPSPPLPAGFIAPCLPTLGYAMPIGLQWVHEIKHDGFRFVARRDGDRVRVFSRHGKDGGAER